MPSPHPYRFSGISDFIAGDGVKPSFAVKIPGLFFVGRVSDALSQIPTTEAKNRADMYAVADEAIAALKAAVVTVEAAYAHVRAACPTSEEIEAEAEAAKVEAAKVEAAKPKAAKVEAAPASIREKSIAGA